MSKDDTNYTRLFDATLDDVELASSSEGSMGVLAGYKLLEKIGEGGMGLIWKAKEPRTGRIVALKQLRFIDAAMDSERASEAAARFDREIGLASRLEHPGIARVYETGADEENRSPFFTMELVEGEPLSGEGCDEREKVRLIMAVCDAVEHAHRNGIIHRDLKPANILVNSYGEVKILDFGVARALQESEIRSDLFAEDPAMTISRHGEVFGTPQFMAPEQARGESSLSDTRTDVFALGSLLFRILTGEFAHSEEGGTWEVINRVATGQIRRPKEVSSTKVPKDLEAVLMKSLAFAPDDRYNSAGGLRRDLESYIEGEPVTAQRLTAAYWLKRHVFRHSKEWVAGLVVFLLALTVAIGWSLQRARFVEEQVFLRENAEAEKRIAKEAQSKSFVRVARDLRESGAKAEALPYLAQAIKLDPDSRIARASLVAAMKQFPNLRRASPTVRFSGPAKEVAFDPNGKWYAVAIHNVGIHFYDIVSHELIRNVALSAKVIDMKIIPGTKGCLAVAFRDFDLEERKDEDTGAILLISPAKGAVARIELPQFVSYFDFLPNGRRMVWGYGNAGDKDGGIEIHDISDLSKPVLLRRHRLKLPPASAPRVAWAADGTRVYYTNGERDGRLHRYHVEEGISESTSMFARPPNTRPYPLSQMDVAADGRIVLTGQAGHISVWEDTKELGPVLLWSDQISTAAAFRNCRFSKDCRYISAASSRGDLSVWNSRTGELLSRLDHGERVLNGYFSPDPDSTLLLTRSETDRYRLWDWASGVELGYPLEGGQRILAAEFSPDGTQILVGRLNHARMWGVSPRNWEPFVVDCGMALGAVKIDSESNRILATSYDKDKAVVVSIPGGQKLGEWNHLSNYATQTVSHQVPAELSSKGRYFATVSSNQEVIVRRRVDFSEVRIPQANPVTALEFHPLEDLLAIGNAVGETNLYRFDKEISNGVLTPYRNFEASGMQTWSSYQFLLKNGESPASNPNQNFVSQIRFSPHGDRLVTAEAPKPVHCLFNWKKGVRVRTPSLMGDNINDVKITYDGRYYLFGGSEHYVRVSHLENGLVYGPGRHHSASIEQLCVSLDSKRFASASSDGEVKFWDIETTGENEPVVIPARKDSVTSLACSKDGVLCASGDTKGKIRLWLMETGETLCDPLDAGCAVNDLAFHEKYSLLVAACEDGKLRLWEIPTGRGRCASEVATLAETMAGLYLNKEGFARVGAVYQFDQMKKRFLTRYQEQIAVRENNSSYRADEYHRLAYEILNFAPIKEPDWILKDD